MTADSPLPEAWDARTLAAVRRKILTWFAKHQRDLPWRKSRDAYAIWVSEVMLQQTTVAAVVPFFHKFMASFPTVRALAAADEQTVLHHWQGLGYYRRARHLHAASKILADQFEGDLPDDPEVWAELPGVGRYILGAVLSQAFDKRWPIVEANTLRVFSRLCGSKLDPRVGAGVKWVWAVAEALLPSKNVGEFNQAMMELGALVCTPDTPACKQCPLNKECVAYLQGLQDSIPPKARRVPVQSLHEVSLIVRRDGQVLVCQRPADAKRWPLMWEVPTGSVSDGETTGYAAERLGRELGLGITLGSQAIQLKYTVTRFLVTLTAFECNLDSDTEREIVVASTIRRVWKWCDPSHLSELPASTPQRKLFRWLASARKELRLF
jgi:A/G-specific adenine glycosylase